MRLRCDKSGHAARWKRGSTLHALHRSKAFTKMPIAHSTGFGGTAPAVRREMEFD